MFLASMFDGMKDCVGVTGSTRVSSNQSTASFSHFGNPVMMVCRGVVLFTITPAAAIINIIRNFPTRALSLIELGIDFHNL